MTCVMLENDLVRRRGMSGGNLRSMIWELAKQALVGSVSFGRLIRVVHTEALLVDLGQSVTVAYEHTGLELRCENGKRSIDATAS